jgi:hypothetical protein
MRRDLDLETAQFLLRRQSFIFLRRRMRGVLK